MDGLNELAGPLLIPLALGAGMFLQIVIPGDFEYVLRTPAPAWIAWFSVLGAIVALVLGLARRRPPLEKMRAALAVAAFLLPVVAGGLLDLRPTQPPAIATLSHGLVDAVRKDVRPGAVVYSDLETSYRIAAFAPVYVANAPPGHVADTEKNRPYERRKEALEFFATGDLGIPRRAGAGWLVVDGDRFEVDAGRPPLYEDERYALYRFAPRNRRRPASRS